MTTIAYKAGVVAYDSRATEGNLIAYRDFNKHCVAEGVHFFFAGSTADYDAFIQCYLQGVREDLPVLDVGVLIVDHGVVYLSAINEDGELWVEKVPKGQHYALGSGAPFALTAMDLHCNAKEAVKMAMLRDCKTGGRIRTYTVKELKK